jgi:colanic acid/amylovoran biosynthesis glycosyltransferase
MKARMIAIGCPADKIRVSYLGVPIDEFRFIDRNGHAGPVRFLHAGRLTAKKGVPDLVKAFADAFPVPGIAELWIAGDGEDDDRVRDAVAASGAASGITILGKVSNGELTRLRAEADVFVLNCRTDAAGTKEGLPIATLEAARPAFR